MQTKITFTNPSFCIRQLAFYRIIIKCPLLKIPPPPKEFGTPRIPKSFTKNLGQKNLILQTKPPPTSEDFTRDLIGIYQFTKSPTPSIKPIVTTQTSSLQSKKGTESEKVS